MTTVRPALDAALRHTIALRTEALFRSSGAFREGHFLLKSGRHGDAYVEKFQVLQDPAATSELCGFFAEHGRGLDREALVDLVAGPTTGGILLAFEVARQLGVEAAYAERAADGSLKPEFRRGTTFEAGTRVLLVDDILTTGGSVRETITTLESQRVEIVISREKDFLHDILRLIVWDPSKHNSMDKRSEHFVKVREGIAISRARPFDKLSVRS